MINFDVIEIDLRGNTDRNYKTCNWRTVTINQLGMCLKKNYSDSPLLGQIRVSTRLQDMNSKSGEEQKKKKKKKGHYVCRSPDFDSNSDTEQKKRSK